MFPIQVEILHIGTHGIDGYEIDCFHVVPVNTRYCAYEVGTQKSLLQKINARFKVLFES